MTRIKNLIFDFDGTLADTSKLIVTTMQKTIQELGLPLRNEEEIKSTIGVRLEEIPVILWPSKKNYDHLFATIYRKNFEIIKEEISIALFPDVKETLTKLKDMGFQMAVATSRSHNSVKELTEKLGIRCCFVYLLGGDDVSQGKPKPDSVYRILSEMDWKKEETLMVGDMGVDILMGNNAGITTCGVTYGNGKTSELVEAGANFLISDFPKLKDIL